MKNKISTLRTLAGERGLDKAPICAARQRLAQAFARLQDFQLVRNHRQDPRFGKAAEERIIWRELLELELQDIDDQIERISAAAGTVPAS